MAGLEAVEALEDPGQGVLHQILGVERAAGGGGQPAVGPAPEADLVAGEKRVHRFLVAAPSPFERARP